MNRLLFVVAVATAVALGVETTLAQGQAGPDGLPAGPAHDTFVSVCSACHAPELVLDKHLDYAGWDDLVQTMIGRGASASPEEAKAITKYLADNLGPSGSKPLAEP